MFRIEEKIRLKKKLNKNLDYPKSPVNFLYSNRQFL